MKMTIVKTTKEDIDGEPTVRFDLLIDGTPAAITFSGEEMHSPAPDRAFRVLLDYLEGAYWMEIRYMYKQAGGSLALPAEVDLGTRWPHHRVPPTPDAAEALLLGVELEDIEETAEEMLYHYREYLRIDGKEVDAAETASVRRKDKEEVGWTHDDDELRSVLSDKQLRHLGGALVKFHRGMRLRFPIDLTTWDPYEEPFIAASAAKPPVDNRIAGVTRRAGTKG
jgi:hypothetical protein